MRRTALLSLCFLVCLGSALGENPVPLVNQPLVPPDAVPGGPAFTLTVNGTGFVSGATVKWNGTALTTTFISRSELTAAVPAAYIAAAGTASVTVLNPGTTAASNVVYFPVASARSLVTFAAAPGSPIEPTEPAAPYIPTGMAAGDFNGDGNLDLAVGVPAELGNPSSYLNTFLGRGDGTFSLVPSSPAVGTSPLSVAVGDFNGDGKLELAVVSSCPSPPVANPPPGYNIVTILLGNGDGTFTPAPGSPVPVGNCPYGVAVADFNGDGKLDLAVANWNDSTVSILLGNGDGTFTPAPGSPVPAPGIPEALAVGDFNGDGKLDLAVANWGLANWPNNVAILLGNGNGTFTPAPGSPVALTTSTPPYTIVAGDFNGGGKLDLAVGGWANDTVAILLGNGDGTFTQEAGCCGASQPTTTRILAMVSGDFYADGKLDLGMADQLYNVGASPASDYLTTMRGNGDGTFTPSEFSLLMADFTYALVAGDFNNDGRLDLAQTSSGQGLSVFLQVPPSGKAPSITIAPAGAAPTPFPPGSTSASVQPGGMATFNNLMVFSLNGFTGTVTLTCSGAPPNATCSVTASTIAQVDTVNLSAADLGVGFTLTVQTTAPTQSLASPRRLPLPPDGRWLAGLCVAMFGLVCIAMLARLQPRRGQACAWALFPLPALLIWSVLWWGCGSPPQPTGGTPPGTYTITVTATSGSLTYSTPFTLTVQ
jgi:hypothetical protein